MKDKFCKDCKHVLKKGLFKKHYYCLKGFEIKLDPVTGKKDKYHLPKSCDFNRSLMRDYCGLEAQWWEPRE